MFGTWSQRRREERRGERREQWNNFWDSTRTRFSGVGSWWRDRTAPGTTDAEDAASGKRWRVGALWRSKSPVAADGGQAGHTNAAQGSAEASSGAMGGTGNAAVTVPTSDATDAAGSQPVGTRSRALHVARRLGSKLQLPGRRGRSVAAGDEGGEGGTAAASDTGHDSRVGDA